MLSKVILPLIALAASCAVSVNAKIEYKTAETDMLYKRADDDSKYNPTSYLFFDREDDIIAPKANCTAETVNTRRCGGDRHSLWTCKQDKKTKTTSWVVDTNTGPDGNNCETHCCRPQETAKARTDKCTRSALPLWENRQYCWQILKPKMLVE